MREYLITGNVIETVYDERGIIVDNRVFYCSGWDFVDEIEYAIEKIYKAPATDGESWHLGIDDCEFLQLVWQKPTITEDEKTMLRILDKKYRYIVRDKDGKLFVYGEKPIKHDKCLVWILSEYGFTVSKFPFSEYFKGITWEDKEPALIEDLLRQGDFI